jgi:hypothetical protein
MEWKFCIWPSILQLRSQVGVHLLALFSLQLAALEVWVVIPLMLLTLASLLGLLARRRAPLEVEFHKEGVTFVRNGHSALVRLQRQYYATAYLQILEFVSADRERQTVIIFPDCASEEDRRKLRLILQWYTFPEHVLSH